MPSSHRAQEERRGKWGEREKKMSTNVLKASVNQSLIPDRDYRRGECRCCFHCVCSDKLAMCDGQAGESGPLPIQLLWTTCHQMDPSVNLNKGEWREEKKKTPTSIPSPPGSRLIFSLTVLSNPALYLLCSAVGAELTSFYSRSLRNISCWELFVCWGQKQSSCSSSDVR